MLPIADPTKRRQGQIVFALGSPQGLQNSLTMGVVSSIARQLDPDSPILYIQTDTPINPKRSQVERRGTGTFAFNSSRQFSTSARRCTASDFIGPSLFSALVKRWTS